MNKKIRKVLKKIEDKGFEAYVVGGYVRDHILGIESTDIDICTNALPKDIIKIFNAKNKPEYGSIMLSDNKFVFDITTYRSESDYKNRKPQKIEYVNNLITDINRRDFTINSICMNYNGQIIDLLKGREDIDSKLIKVIGDTNKKLTEDPLRILRAIRFSVVLDFDLDTDILNFIKYNKKLIRDLSFTRKEEELSKIFSSKNVEKGLNLLKELDLMDALSINYDKVVPVADLLGIWAQIDFDCKYQFNKSSLEVINQIRNIITEQEFNKETLFSNNLYVLMVAGEILGFSKNDITKMYSSLPVKNIKDLKVSSEDIMKILDIKPSKKIKIIYEDLIDKVLNQEIKNNYNSLKKYLINKWK